MSVLLARWAKRCKPRLTVAVHAHEGKAEVEWEEVYVQTRNLPAGLQVRAGRFASQVGCLNEQHPQRQAGRRLGPFEQLATGGRLGTQPPQGSRSR